MVSDWQNEASSVPVLDDRYELGPMIGEGSIGRVFAARDLELGIQVAVKVMRSELARHPELVRAFAEEAKLSARMMSPHVVKVLGLAVSREGAPCIVYELLEGESLAARLDREGGLPLAETAEIVRQTARALARAHAMGVIHRDVKPDNIFLAKHPDGGTLVKLLDFGIAERTAGPFGAASDMLVGTPEYMAPEIVLGRCRADARADVYALGVVAFECLTGRCPFPGEHIDEIMIALTRGARPELGELRPDLPPEADEWMDRALHPDPYWRFATAKEASDAIDEVTRAAQPRRAALRRAA